MKFLKNKPSSIKRKFIKGTAAVAGLGVAAAVPYGAYKTIAAINKPYAPDNYSGRVTANVLSGKIPMDELSQRDQGQVMKILKMKKLASSECAAIPIPEMEKDAFVGQVAAWAPKGLTAIKNILAGAKALPVVATVGKGSKAVGGVAMKGLEGSYYLGEFNTAKKVVGDKAKRYSTASSPGSKTAPKVSRTRQNENFLNRTGTAVRKSFY